MRIAITGASGFIGANLVPLLEKAGHELRLLSRQPARQKNSASTEWVYGELQDNASLRNLVSGADAVINLAAMVSIKDGRDDRLIEVNTTGIRLLAAAAQEAGVRRFIHISSAIAYEQAPYDQPMDEHRPLLQSQANSYAWSKSLAQAIALEHNQQGMEVLVLAPTGVMGPNDHQPSLLGELIIKLYTGQVPALFPGGIDLVDVRDVAAAIVTALTSGTPGQAYLLSGNWATLGTLCEYIGAISGKRIALPVLPLWLVYAVLPVVRIRARITRRPALYTRQAVDTLVYSNKRIDHTRAQQELGFHPRPLRETVKDSLAQFFML